MAEKNTQQEKKEQQENSTAAENNTQEEKNTEEEKKTVKEKNTLIEKIKELVFLRNVRNIKYIRYQILFVVTFILLCQITLSTYTDITSRRDDLRDNLTDKGRVFVEILEEALVEPLWQYNVSITNDIGESMFSDLDVYYISIIDHRDELLYEEGDKDDELIYFESEIIRNNDAIGFIVLGISTNVIREEVANILRASFIKALLLFLVLGSILYILINNIMVEMERMNNEIVEARDALWGEMELAKKIQMKLLPELPAMNDYEIAAYMEPADEVGGDYYDIINVGGYNWIIIGDVSGHGVPAGLIMMMTQTAIHIALAQNPEVAPDKLLSIINSTISRNIERLGENKYMTITVLAGLKDGKFMFSGLHQDILIYRKETEQVDIVETSGMWIGLVDDISDMLEVDSLNMAPGDVMILYSDGITEAKNKESMVNKAEEIVEYGEDRLTEFFKRKAKLPVDDIKSALLDDLKDYQCDDDVTMVIIRRIV